MCECMWGLVGPCGIVGILTMEGAVSNETIFVCCFAGCSASFPNGKKLKWHMRLHSGDRPFECPHPGCGKKYTRQFHLTRHLKQSHESPKEPSSEPLKCTQEGCGKLFSSQNALYKHTKYSHQKRKFKCEHCPKTFVKHQHLKVHGFEHTAVLPYPCPEPGCSKAFLLPSRLRAHQRTHRGYACDVQGCEEVFTKWTLLRKHRKVDHQRRFSCDACGREFFSKWNLKVHAETHGEQEEGSLYCCPHEGCSRFYSHAKNLRQHLASAHENRRFPCDVPGCSRTFFAKQSLKRHKATHDPNKPLPQKRTGKARCRQKNYPSKSAAAILSGHVPPAESEHRLLSGQEPADPLTDCSPHETSVLEATCLQPPAEPPQPPVEPAEPPAEPAEPPAEPVEPPAEPAEPPAEPAEPAEPPAEPAELPQPPAESPEPEQSPPQCAELAGSVHVSCGLNVVVAEVIPKCSGEVSGECQVLFDGVVLLPVVTAVHEVT